LCIVRHGVGRSDGARSLFAPETPRQGKTETFINFPVSRHLRGEGCLPELR
jgi:hypothetical protein